MAKKPSKEVDTKECAGCTCKVCTRKCSDCCDMCNIQGWAQPTYNCQNE